MKIIDLATIGDHIFNEAAQAYEILRICHFLIQSVSAGWCAFYLSWQFKVISEN